jgi:hypothetical protein
VLGQGPSATAAERPGALGGVLGGQPLLVQVGCSLPSCSTLVLTEGCHPNRGLPPLVAQVLSKSVVYVEVPRWP